MATTTMARTTKAVVLELFQAFCKKHGRKVATSYKDVGAWALDYNAIYGGYVIRQYLEKGGESNPMGIYRYSPKEFANMLRFAILAASYR